MSLAPNRRRFLQSLMSVSAVAFFAPRELAAQSTPETTTTFRKLLDQWRTVFGCYPAVDSFDWWWLDYTARNMDNFYNEDWLLEFGITQGAYVDGVLRKIKQENERVANSPPVRFLPCP